MDAFSESDPFVVVELYHEEKGEDGKIVRQTIAEKTSSVQSNTADPVWNEQLELPVEGEWDVKTLKVDLKLFDEETLRSNQYVGKCTVSLEDLLTEPDEPLLVCDEDGNAVLGSKPPYWPCEINVDVYSQPDGWPTKAVKEPPESYPKHIFMMTRGTRGDVQPFVALARGMAKTRGWLVTICTEYNYKSFVQANAADVSPGRIAFKPSGGDTQKRVNSAMGQWATNQKSEFLQMVMLASCEGEFFPSATAIIQQILDLESYKPVDLLVFAFTLTGIAAIASEYCKKPMAGFYLQPSGIPSEDPNWTAIQAIESHGCGLIDEVEKMNFTGHGSLALFKAFAEENPFASWNLSKMRGWFGLPAAKTWPLLKDHNTQLVIPMRGDTFPRPFDWWDGIKTTDFIFLRKGPVGGGDLQEPIKSFVEKAHDSGAKVGLMSFSSMPVARATIIEILVKMVEECSFNLRMLFVGNPPDKEVPEELMTKADALKGEDKILEMDRADFGQIFKYMDIFVVHGGLGTTVEALRMKKPVAISGPLLLDQRFWGDVCCQKGVGPPPVTAENFPEHCVAFADGATNPEDPNGYQAKAAEQDWGDTAEDGVEANVKCFEDLLDGNPSPLETQQ